MCYIFLAELGVTYSISLPKNGNQKIESKKEVAGFPTYPTLILFQAKKHDPSITVRADETSTRINKPISSRWKT